MKKHTVWDRRFKHRKDNARLDEFNASIDKDRFLWREEIDASRAYADALRQSGVLSRDEHRTMEQGLQAVRNRLESGLDLRGYEDIHSAVELLLIEEIGESGKKLHTGRSRNEQVVCDERLYLKNKLPEIIRHLNEIQHELIHIARKYPNTILPGYTHLQQAQCILFPHYIMSFFWPVERAKSRLYDSLKRISALPLGSGALAGSTVPLDQEFLRERLDFVTVMENSLDSVTDRTFILEPLFALALLMLDMSRFAEDIILYSSREFGFLHLDDGICTSSSLMPQKKNPDCCELVRSRAGMLMSYVTSLFIIVKGLPSSYNKDLQEDKTPLREGIEETLRTLSVIKFIIRGITLQEDILSTSLHPHIFATDIVDYLIKKGVFFREAHGITAELVRFAESNNLPLDELSLDVFKSFCHLFDRDVLDVFSGGFSIRKKKTAASTHPEHVLKQIDEAEKSLPAQIRTPPEKR